MLINRLNYYVYLIPILSGSVASGRKIAFKIRILTFIQILVSL